jgi:N-acetylmuramoyl-L-alanine amidase
MAANAPNPLLLRLATVWRHEKLRHPGLRAAALAHWMAASAGGASRLAQAHYNFAHLQWRRDMAPFASRVVVSMKGEETAYCAFPTLESFISGYWAFLNRAPYSGWEEHAQNGEDFLKFVAPIQSPAPGSAARALRQLAPARKLLESLEAQAPASAPVSEPVARVDLGAIVIDPGHGGEKALACSSPNNAISASGVKEKKLTLDFALALREEIERQARRAGERVEVVLTREGDVNLSCHARAGKAKACGARAFLSLHFNGGAPAASGVETYVRAAQNGNGQMEADLRFARIVQQATLAGMRAFNPQARDRGVKPDTDSKPGSIGVLDGRHLGQGAGAPRTVAALTELEFITNPTVDRLIVSGPDAIANRARVAREIAGALRLYLKDAQRAA